MDVFKYTAKLASIFVEDKVMVQLLGMKTTDIAQCARKLRRRNQQVDEYEPSDLNFIAFYFADAATTNNAYVNKGLLRIDIYTKTRADAAKIRERIVHLLHEHCDERVATEGQYASGIKEIYKYRLEYTPLVSN